jgi:hypothetical protein
MSSSVQTEYNMNVYVKFSNSAFCTSFPSLYMVYRGLTVRVGRGEEGGGGINAILVISPNDGNYTDTRQ